MKDSKHMKAFVGSVRGALENYEEGLVSETELVSWLHNLAIGKGTDLISRYQKRMIDLQNDVNILVDVITED